MSYPLVLILIIESGVIYGLLNDVISDNAFVYCAIPFGHYG